MITKDIVPESIARLLYKKGFDESCMFWYTSVHTLAWPSVENGLFKCNHEFRKNEGYYKDECCPVSAPIFGEVTRWFRDVHHVDICTCRELDEHGKCLNGYIAVVYKDGYYKVTIRDIEKDLGYEDATNKAIEYGLTLI